MLTRSLQLIIEDKVRSIRDKGFVKIPCLSSLRTFLQVGCWKRLGNPLVFEDRPSLHNPKSVLNSLPMNYFCSFVIANLVGWTQRCVKRSPTRGTITGPIRSHTRGGQLRNRPTTYANLLMTYFFSFVIANPAGRAGRCVKRSPIRGTRTGPIRSHTRRGQLRNPPTTTPASRHRRPFGAVMIIFAIFVMPTPSIFVEMVPLMITLMGSFWILLTFLSRVDLKIRRFPNKGMFLLLGVVFFFSSCQKEKEETLDPGQVLSELEDHYRFLLEHDTVFLPRSPERPTVGIKDWTSGFLPGVLWYLYAENEQEAWRNTAHRFTMPLAPLKSYRGTHDLGFMLYNSFGNGYRITDEPAYKSVLTEGAYSLASRYDSTVGAIKSWDWGAREGWQYPVIIDNMMNLEFLFWAAKTTGDDRFYHIAYNHAKTTLKHHFRADHGSYHVVDYDTLTGEPRWKGTYQGMADPTAWARGQAWGLYGFTAAFRETRDSTFLRKAHQIAGFITQHPNLPVDKVPYWDFDAESSESTPRDVSAAVITASALLELQTYSQRQQSDHYKSVAHEILTNVSNRYRYNHKNPGCFFLDHSTGHLPGDSEVDMPIIYAEYYFVEALIRYAKYAI